MTKSCSSGEDHRNQTLDILRGAAIICVIFTHLPEVTLRYNFFLWWFYALFIGMAVPVFMILMGYCAVMAAEKRDLSLAQLYGPGNIFRKLRRYFLPFIPIVALQLASVVVFTPQMYSVKEYFTLLITGGLGPGNYYIPVLLQFVFIFPLLFAVRKHALAVSLLINILFEAAVHYFSIPAEIYKICILRYLFLIGCGMSMFENKERTFSRSVQTVVTVAGMIYLFYMTVFLDFGRCYPHWWSTCCLSGLYLYFPIRNLIVSGVLDKLKFKRAVCFLAYAGKCSYHIFLVQMLYFFACGYFFELFGVKQLVRYIVTAVLAFTATLFIGCLYCRLEQYLDSLPFGVKKIKN